MDLSDDVPRHRPLVFDKMERLIKEMQDPEDGVRVRSQKLFLSVIPSAFTGYDCVEWLIDRFSSEDTSNVEAVQLGSRLCQYGYFFPVNDLKNLCLKDDSSLYRFQSPYYWPWQGPRAGSSGAPALGPDNVEYAIYLVKRTLRNKQRHALEDYEQEALANLRKNLSAKWEFITMQAEEQVRLAKDRKKGDKIVSDSQERAYWRVARPPPGGPPGPLEPCPVPVRTRHPRPKKRTVQQLNREIEQLKASLDRTRVKTSIALEALTSYADTFAPYDPWLTPMQPSNPWIAEDPLYWQINSPIVEVPTEKRVQRWALSIEELVSDPTGLQEFTSFLRKEYSHENIRFWLAVMDLRRSSTKQIPKKLQDIYDEFLKPGAKCEINIDGATAEKVAEGLKSGSRYAFDHAAEHVYSLLLKKDCYPRFIRSDHFQRLLVEGRNVQLKKAKFFNFGGQVKKKPSSASGSCGGVGLNRRRGSDRSLSGSAHELALCAAAAPRAPTQPSHSHSQSNLADILPVRDPLDDSTDEALPWERAPVYGSAGRRRQDSAADSGSSSSDVSAALPGGSGHCALSGGGLPERVRRLPQQSTLDGGLRGAPPPLRRLSAVEPRHLAPLGSPPHSPRAPVRAPPVTSHAPPHPPPHPTPTISVSSAPEEDSPGSGSTASVAHSDEPSSVFASTAATPTDPNRTLPETRDNDERRESCDESTASAVVSELTLHEDDKIERPPLVRVSSKESPTSSRDTSRIEVSEVATEPLPTRTVAPLAETEDIGDECADRVSPAAVPTPVTSRVSEPSIEHIDISQVSEPPVARVRVPESPPGSQVPEASAGSQVPELIASSQVPELIAGSQVPEPRPVGSQVPETRPVSESDAQRANFAHKVKKDELTSVSESSIVRRDRSGERTQRNDICPWEDESSCESDAPFVKTYATLGYL